MCFSSPKVSSPAPTPPTPTVASTGDAETTAENNDKERKRLRAAAGYQQNILSGTTGTSSNSDKKSLLG